MASTSIAQQRLMGMAWAARTGRLDTSKLTGDFKDTIEKIANSDTFSDESLRRFAKTKYRDEETDKLMPYKIGKGTYDEPDMLRRPYKKRQVVEGYNLMSYNEYLYERRFQNFHNNYIKALNLLNDSLVPDISEMYETFKNILENISLNPGMNVIGMGPVSLPGNPGTSTDFHNQEVGSGDMPVEFKKKKKKPLSNEEE